ncbi:MAG: CfrBI family restriction endonuclease [Ignavibacteria bacterium]|nr:CfrBI family restriction endonuclease [Ignavibacteria bacterium]
MGITIETKKAIIKKVITNQDYRDEVIIVIDELFLNYCLGFLKKVFFAKLDNLDITVDWYKKTFLDESLPKKEYAIHAGLNMKSITNAFNTARKQVVLEAANNNYIRLLNTINELVSQTNELDINLTIKIKGVSADLTINETMIVINTLAVKRAEIRGGLWSEVGKQVEKTLMLTLSKLFNVPTENLNQTDNPESFREVDFYILSNSGEKLRTEVKLMGKGNPESADAIFARNPKIFLADKLSDKNKTQAELLGIKWIELRSENGYRRFLKMLDELNVPHLDFTGDLNERLDVILNEIYAG